MISKYENFSAYHHENFLNFRDTANQTEKHEPWVLLHGTILGKVQEQHIADNATTRKSSACAVGWTKFDHTEKCYKMITSRNSWTSALSACKAAVSAPSATLASIPDQATNDFLMTVSSFSSVWIGGFKNSDGQWAWADGSQMTFINWGGGQPNNCCNGRQDYVVFYPFWNGKWNDLKENRRKRALCQYAAPVQGNWGSWNTWSSCSESCNSGSRNRSRECNNPAPAHGGQECEGIGIVTEICNSHPCPGIFHETEQSVLQLISPTNHKQNHFI